VVPASEGEVRSFTLEKQNIAGVVWSADGCEILFSSNWGGLFALWWIPVTGGRPQLVTAPGEALPSRVATGKLAYVRMKVDWNVWRSGPAASQAAPPVKLIASRRSGGGYSPDGRRSPSSRSAPGGRRSGSATATAGRSVTAFRGPPTGTPRSPGRPSLVLDSRAAGQADVYVVDADGGAPRATTRQRGRGPELVRDGRSVYFTSDRGRERVWKAPAEGGPAVAVTEDGRASAESADKRWLYYWKAGAVWRQPLNGGPKERILEHGR
jgi:Tol biopolymer transport system component